MHKKNLNTSNNLSFIVYLIIFLFIIILIFPSVVLLLTKNYRDNSSKDNNSNDKTQIVNNSKKYKPNNKNSKSKSNVKQNKKSDTDNSIAVFNKNTNRKLYFKKNINVYLKNNNKIVTLPIEEYIKGVVAAEMPANFSDEALKAQAIAARTYTYMCLNQNKDGCPYNKKADITDDYREYQAFLTKKIRMELWPKSKSDYYWNKISKAVDATKGEVVFYNNNIIYAAFHSNSGGRTEDASSVTSGNYPYLKSVASPGEESDTDFKSTSSVDVSAFNYTLKQINNKFTSISTKQLLNNIKILSKTPGDRIGKIRIGNCIFTGLQLRSAFKLKSTNISFSINKNKITFTTKGFGHGMGMSQYGADILAKKGYNCNKIIHYYYSGVKIYKVY